MRNTTKLKHILQLYTISLDMDDENNFHLTIMSKRTGSAETYSGKSYSVVIEKAFGHMKKGLKDFN
jgi:hypothetical protein